MNTSVVYRLLIMHLIHFHVKWVSEWVEILQYYFTYITVVSIAAVGKPTLHSINSVSIVMKPANIVAQHLFQVKHCSSTLLQIKLLSADKIAEAHSGFGPWTSWSEVKCTTKCAIPIPHFQFELLNKTKIAGITHMLLLSLFLDFFTDLILTGRLSITLL